MGTHKIYSSIQGIRDNILGSLYGDCHELLAPCDNISGSLYGDCHELLALFYVLITWP